MSGSFPPPPSPESGENSIMDTGTQRPSGAAREFITNALIQKRDYHPGGRLNFNELDMNGFPHSQYTSLKLPDTEGNLQTTSVPANSRPFWNFAATPSTDDERLNATHDRTSGVVHRSDATSSPDLVHAVRSSPSLTNTPPRRRLNRRPRVHWHPHPVHLSRLGLPLTNTSPNQGTNRKIAGSRVTRHDDAIARARTQQRRRDYLESMMEQEEEQEEEQERQQPSTDALEGALAGLELEGALTEEEIAELKERRRMDEMDILKEPWSRP
ncbi:MAG: hypothetical protein Q9222_005773 [Ikaeria aurantiellina]